MDIYNLRKELVKLKTELTQLRCLCHLCRLPSSKVTKVISNYFAPQKERNGEVIDTTNLMLNEPNIWCRYLDMWKSMSSSCCCVTHSEVFDCDQAVTKCFCPKCCRLCMVEIKWVDKLERKHDCPWCLNKKYIYTPCLHQRGICGEG